MADKKIIGAVRFNGRAYRAGQEKELEHDALAQGIDLTAPHLAGAVQGFNAPGAAAAREGSGKSSGGKRSRKE